MNRISIYLLLIFFSITNHNIFSQDIITKTDGTLIKAKVLEINTNDIKYKKFDYQDGPTITILTTELTSIKYPDGQIDNFKSLDKQNKLTDINESNKDSLSNINGLIKTYYPSGELQSETPYVNGKINGIQKLYYQNGTLMSECSFNNGLANGAFKTYYKNSKIHLEANYQQGKINGILKDYSDGIQSITYNFIDNSGISKDGNYSLIIPENNGIINGYVKLYKKNKLRIETHYINNVPNGLMRFYNTKGSIITTQNYIDGSLNSNKVIGEVAKGIQQGAAYESMLNNTNSQTVNNYTQIAINNYTKGQSEAIISNKTILESANIASNNSKSAESSAATNGGQGFNTNVTAAKKCNEATSTEWKSRKPYNDAKDNPGCSKLALKAQLDIAELLLRNCGQYLPPAEKDGFDKTIISLKSQIANTPDCQTYNYGK